MGSGRNGRVNYTFVPAASPICSEIRLSGVRISVNEPPRSPQSRLADLDLEEHLADPGLKQRFVTPMFDVIAPKYDRFTRVFSFGMDVGWKRELIALVSKAIPTNARVLDLACGTGDLAFAAGAIATRGSVLGIDASPMMIEQARDRASRQRSGDSVRFAVGDLTSLDVPDASADVITAGYALRNAPNYELGVAEIARVLRPGGVLATLDFYRPESWLWRRLLLFYLSIAGNLVGWLWHREPVVYGYIARSIDHFVSWQRFSASLEANGLQVETVRTKLLGGVAIHVAVKRR
jgi:demethylmenaquinone methyltransferase / 2-methoxy-6-polyprenyl-1,4-benzoquinol methylase